MKIKAKDIANKMGVSPAAVSLVLNNKPGVGEEKRKQILAYIKECGYTTSAITAGKVEQRGKLTFVVYKKHGKVVGDSHFYYELMEEIERDARNHGYVLSVVYMSEGSDKISDVIKMIAKERPAGLLILATEMVKKDLKLFKQMKVPMVILDNDLEEDDVDSVSIDNEEGIRRIIGYLTERGHEKIGYLHSVIPIRNFEQRFLAMKKELGDRGIAWQEQYVCQVQSSNETAYYDFLQRFSVQERPTALIADTDAIAMGAIKDLKANGVSVPEEVSVVGFDNMPFSEMVDPPLTSIHVFRPRFGSLALKRLFERIENCPEEKLRILVGTKLIVRKSVKVRQPERKENK